MSNSIITRSRLKEIIKASLAEDSELDVNLSDPDYTFYTEAKKPKKEEDVEDVEIEDTEELDIEEPTPADDEAEDDDFAATLRKLKRQADAIGDPKLEQQVDNTITYFTRQHIVKDDNPTPSMELEEAQIDDMEWVNDLEAILLDENSLTYESLKPKQAVKESIEVLKMKKIAGLISESQYAQALLETYESTEFPLTPQVKGYINRTIQEAEENGELVNLIGQGFFELELAPAIVKDIFSEGNNNYVSASPEVVNYINESINKQLNK